MAYKCLHLMVGFARALQGYHERYQINTTMSFLRAWIEENVCLCMCHNDTRILSQPCVDDLFDFDQTTGRPAERLREKLDLHGHGCSAPYAPSSPQDCGEVKRVQ